MHPAYADTHNTINSLSMRYVEAHELGYYTPAAFRRGSPSIKQGSLSETLEGYSAQLAQDTYQHACKVAFEAYKSLLSLDVCREQARGVLPEATFTTFIMTGSLWSWWHFYNLRNDPAAQVEVQCYAAEIDAPLSEMYPYAWNLLKEYFPPTKTEKEALELLLEVYESLIAQRDPDMDVDNLTENIKNLLESHSLI
jgi:thymidylate synthase (FAD)